MNFNDLTNEQKAKARTCNTPEELNALANEEGNDLSDEQLEGISGGVEDPNANPCNDRYHHHYL